MALFQVNFTIEQLSYYGQVLVEIAEQEANCEEDVKLKRDPTFPYLPEMEFVMECMNNKDTPADCAAAWHLEEYNS